MYPDDAKQFQARTGHPLTRHAWKQMSARGISDEAVMAAFQHGRRVYVRGAMIHAIGRKEIEFAEKEGHDLRPFHGVQVVCNAHDGTVITVYRNRDFRGLRPRGRHNYHDAQDAA